MTTHLLGRRLLASARLARWEREIVKAVEAALTRAKTRVTHTITAAGDGDAFGEDEWDTDLIEEVEPVIARILTEMAEGAVTSLSLTPEQMGKVLGAIDPSKDVQSFIALIRGIGPQAARRINSALTLGVHEGEGIPELAARVESVFSMAMNRATTIARTETNRAANRTGYEAANEINKTLPITKTWLATNDDRTREDHADADGQEVPFDEPFDVGGFAGMFPGDPDLPVEEVVNCRCAVTYDAADESNSQAADDLQAQADEEGG